MCGIVGFTGRREASPVLLEGLRRLEYRGYDSAGLVTGTGNELHLRKKAGRLAALRNHVAHCVADAFSEGNPEGQRQKVEELVDIMGRMTR